MFLGKRQKFVEPPAGARTMKLDQRLALARFEDLHPHAVDQQVTLLEVSHWRPLFRGLELRGHLSPQAGDHFLSEQGDVLDRLPVRHIASV